MHHVMPSMFSEQLTEVGTVLGLTGIETD